MQIGYEFFLRVGRVFLFPIDVLYIQYKKERKKERKQARNKERNGKRKTLPTLKKNS